MRTDGISVVIPNWNHELALPRSIRSALRAVQDLRERGLDGEVLIVDDASRDGSLVLLRQLEALYSNQGLHVVALDQNVGPAAARNIALAEVGFQFVTFSDADNEIVPENLHLFYRAIRDTEAAVVFGNLLVYEPDQVDFCSHESFVTRMFQRNHIDTCSLCDVEQLLDAGAFWPDPRNNLAEDWEFYLHLATNGRRLVHVPILFGCYFCVQLSRNQTNPDNQVRLIQRIYNQFPEARAKSSLNTLHLRYHPELGYL